MPSLVLPTAADLAFIQGLETPPSHWGGTGLDIYHRLQPDARDWLAPQHPGVAQMLEVGVPDEWDNSAKVCQLLNQGSDGSCVCFSICHSIQVDQNLERQVCYQFDATRLYHEMGGTGPNGVDTRGTLQRCVDLGAPTLQGARVRVGSYFFIDQTPGIFEQQIKAAVASGKCVVLATLLPSGFGFPSSGNPTTGYHQLAVVAYQGRTFRGPNSWGPNFGRGGFYEMSFDYVEQSNFLGRYTFAFFFDTLAFEGPPDPKPLPTNRPAAVLVLVNQERARVGAPPLVRDSRLDLAAQSYAQQTMADRNWYQHNGPDGSTPETRINAAGIPGHLTWGENIAAGLSDPAQVMQAWMNSPGHRSNILSPAFTHIGIGVGENPASTYKTYWCQDFAALTGVPPPPPPVSLTVTSYSPNPVAGGQVFRVNGSGFSASNIEVKWGTTPLPVTVTSPTQLEIVAPRSVSGTNALWVRVEGTWATGPPLTITDGGGGGGGGGGGTGDLDIILIGRKSPLVGVVSVWAYTRDLTTGVSLPAICSGTVNGTVLVAQQNNGTQRPAVWQVRLPVIGQTITITVHAETTDKKKADKTLTL